MPGRSIGIDAHNVYKGEPTGSSRNDEERS